jgi:hypothetical protein
MRVMRPYTVSTAVLHLGPDGCAAKSVPSAASGPRASLASTV